MDLRASEPVSEEYLTHGTPRCHALRIYPGKVGLDSMIRAHVEEPTIGILRACKAFSGRFHFRGGDLS